MIYGFTMLSPAPTDIFNLENRDLIRYKRSIQIHRADYHGDTAVANTSSQGDNGPKPMPYIDSTPMIWSQMKLQPSSMDVLANLKFGAIVCFYAMMAEFVEDLESRMD